MGVAALGVRHRPLEPGYSSRLQAADLGCVGPFTIAFENREKSLEVAGGEISESFRPGEAPEAWLCHHARRADRFPRQRMGPVGVAEHWSWQRPNKACDKCLTNQ